MPLAPFLARLPQSRIIRVPGLAVFMTGNPDYVPTSLLHNLKHNKVLHENVLFVTVENEDVPEVSPRRRAEVSDLAPGIHRVILRYGFMESPNIPRALEDLTDRLGVRVSAGQLLPRPRGPGAGPWRRNCPGGAGAVPVHGAQRGPGDGVLPHSQRPGGGTRGADHDLIRDLPTSKIDLARRYRRPNIFSISPLDSFSTVGRPWLQVAARGVASIRRSRALISASVSRRPARMLP